jgi:hypothetical protein
VRLSDDAEFIDWIEAFIAEEGMPPSTWDIRQYVEARASVRLDEGTQRG